VPTSVLIGLRYLSATRNANAPSVITLISVFAVAIGVTALIVVLAVMGGFEADLRDKILGAKAHVLVTGPDRGPMDDAAAVLAAADAHAEVVGASPFIESELLISSPTNYTGVILRGIDPTRIGSTSNLPDDIVDGRLAWLDDPEAARPQRDPLMDRTDALNGEAEALLREARELREELEALERQAGIEGSGAVGQGGDAADTAADADADAEGSAAAAPDRPRRSPMPALPPPVSAQGGDGRPSAMPGLPTPTASNTTPSGLTPLPGPGARRVPGVILGSELRDTLNVVVGETVELVNPDGPVGPTGPVPTVRRFRVVGVFYTGLYEFDHRMAYTTIPDARALLNLGATEISGVEMRVARMDRADEVRVSLASTLDADAYEVFDWKQLNASLFDALLLERFVMGLLLMIIVLVASFAIINVLIMVVIQKGAEIAILRSMGCTKRTITGIFVVQGVSIGVIGTALGAILGLGLVAWLELVGFPLDPEVYYIDQVPVEIDVIEIVAVLAGAVTVSLLATLYPSMQAARLDPASGLRYE